MSVRMMTAVWDLALPPSEKLVLLALADWARDDGRCWPSIEQVAVKSGVSERTVQRMLREAEKAGLLTRIENKGKGCEYRLTPRHCVTPDNMSPVTNDAETPDTVSPNTLATVNRSEANASSRVARPSFPAPDGVPDQVWTDFLASPNRRKAGMSQTAYSGICNQLTGLAEHGYPPGRVIALAVERGWKTVKLEWVQNDERSNTQHGLRGTRPDPALDLYRSAIAAEERENREADSGTGLALPSYRTG